MGLVELVILVLLGLTGWIGAARAAARSFLPLAAGILVTLVGAAICWAIGESREGSGFLAGIVGIVMALSLLVVAAGLLLGALGRWLYEAWRGAPAPRSEPLVPAWDMMGLTGLASLAVLFSLFE